MKVIDPDSFASRLILNGVDKLVFTLLLSIIFAWWTSLQSGQERENLRTEEVNDIKLRKPIALMEELSNPVRECILFVRRSQVSGINTPEDKSKLASLSLEIVFQLGMIENYAENREGTIRAVETLRTNVKTFERLILTRKDAKLDDYSQFANQLHRDFNVLSKFTIDETIAAISGDPRSGSAEPLTQLLH